MTGPKCPLSANQPQDRSCARTHADLNESTFVSDKWRPGPGSGVVGGQKGCAFHAFLLPLWSFGALKEKSESDWRHPFVLFFTVELWENGEQGFMCPKQCGVGCSCTLKLWGRRLGSVFESPGECVWENLCGLLESPQREGIKHKCTDFTTGVGTRALWSQMPWKKCSLFAAWQTFVLQVLRFTSKVVGSLTPS